MDTGSTPVVSTNAQVTELVYVLALEARFCGFESHPVYQNFMEVVRLVEDTVLKTAGAYKALGGSSPSASAI
jgi:hypothetical protein